MFNSKQKRLFTTESKETSAFVKAGLKKDAVTISGNGAKKFYTTGLPFVDQFTKLGTYKVPRSFEDITNDCEILWATDKVKAVYFIFYIRMITRIVTFFNGTSTKVSQKGAELKHEGIMRMIWLYFKAPEIFWNNIGIFVSVGSWKDIIMMLSYDLQYNGWKNRKLDWDKFANLIMTSLENKNTCELLKKFLPKAEMSSKKETNENNLHKQADVLIGKFLIGKLYPEYIGADAMTKAKYYRMYRKLKSNGTAHEWQQLISKKKFDRIDFNKIHGRALSLLVRGKFLDNSGLRSKYETWIAKPETTNVKYTGFVHEPFSVCSKYETLIQMPVAERDTINKQFDTLVNKGGEKKNSKTIIVLDTSGSMDEKAIGTDMSSRAIGKALALYFSEFLTGKFANAWIEFNSDAKMHIWQGKTPLEKWYNDKSSCVGSTNFQSVIKLFVDLKKQGVSESDFPNVIICISDGEFDPTYSLSKTNVEVALESLRKGGFSENYVRDFVIVLWNIPNEYYSKNRKTTVKFETYGDVPNVFYFSGYSAATVSFLSNDIKTASELFEEAMKQEAIQMIEI